MRADSAFYSRAMLTTALTFDVRFSVTARQDKQIRAAIAAIPDSAWTPIAYWLSAPGNSGADRLGDADGVVSEGERDGVGDHDLPADTAGEVRGCVEYRELGGEVADRGDDPPGSAVSRLRPVYQHDRAGGPGRRLSILVGSCSTSVRVDRRGQRVTRPPGLTGSGSTRGGSGRGGPVLGPRVRGMVAGPRDGAPAGPEQPRKLASFSQLQHAGRSPDGRAEEVSDAIGDGESGGPADDDSQNRAAGVAATDACTDPAGETERDKYDEHGDRYPPRRGR